MFSGATPTRELSEQERALCVQVVRQWTTQGTLKFVRKPLSGVITVAVLTAAGAGWLGWQSYRDIEPFLPYASVAVPWPWDPPARVELTASEGQGVKLALESEPFDTERKTIKLSAEISEPKQLSGRAAEGARTLKVPITGSYCTLVRKVYVISDLLKRVANETDTSVVPTEDRAAAQRAVELLGRLAGDAGYLEPGIIPEEDLQGLLAKRIIEPRQQMISPIAFDLTADVPLAFRAKLGWIYLVFTLVAAGALLLAGFAWRASLGEHWIELTRSHLREYQDGTILASVEWENADAQESDGTLTITDRSLNVQHKYKLTRFQHSSELRAAIIARIGLTEITHTVHYETY